jgi:hypothetical protein
MSLDDQEDNAKAAIAELYDGPVEFHLIKNIAKGERLDRPELDQIEKLYASGIFDIFIFDDLSRLIRGGEAARLLGVGVDHGTRSICINDGIDTVDETWEEDALSACSENVAHNERGSRRIKQKKTNRWTKFGTTARRRIAGYIFPEGATTCSEWLKDDSATEFIQKGLEILRRTLNGAAVAEYFNSVGFRPGPRVIGGKWDGTAALRFYRNPILKGRPGHGFFGTPLRIMKPADGNRWLIPRGPFIATSRILPILIRPSSMRWSSC